MTPDGIDEMYSQLSPTVRMFFETELFYMNKFSSQNGGKVASRANGYQAKIIKGSTNDGIERYYSYQAMTTPANTSIASAGAVDVDQAPPTLNTRVLTGDYGITYGYVNRELYHKVKGGKGGQSRNDMSDHLATELAQSMSTKLNSDIYANGATNAIDGFEHWVKTTGTKWNSEDMTTATYLKGRAETTLTLATWNVPNIRRVIRRTHQGLIGTSISEGRKPSFCVCNSALLDILKDELDKLKILNQGPSPEQSAEKFPFLGVLDDYVFVDGVLFFTDYYLDDNLGGNAGIFYMGNHLDFEIIVHQDYMFSDWDAVKEDKKVTGKWKNIPGKLDRDVAVSMMLWNLYHKRPRNFTKGTLAT